MNSKPGTNRPFLCLFDSGSNLTWVKEKSLPHGIQSHLAGQPIVGSTMAGTFTSTKAVDLAGITIPELSPSRAVTKLHARVMEADCRYDIIFGRDFLSAYGIVIDFEEGKIHSLQASIPMREVPPKDAPGELQFAMILEGENEDSILLAEFENYGIILRDYDSSY